MPIQHINTFTDILSAWTEARREADKRAVWRLLARNGWFLACRSAVQQQDRTALASWLDMSHTAQRDIIEFNGAASAQMVRVYLHCGLLACGQLESRLADAPIGFCKDLTLAFSGLPLRHPERDVSLTVLLVDTARNEGTVAVLTLALLSDGAGELYPAPELSFLRDVTFQQAEENARASLKATGLWSPMYDVRWSLKRRDDKPITNLSGPSMGAAFALGIGKLCTSL